MDMQRDDEYKLRNVFIQLFSFIFTAFSFVSALIAAEPLWVIAYTISIVLLLFFYHRAAKDTFVVFCRQVYFYLCLLANPGRKSYYFDEKVFEYTFTSLHSLTDVKTFIVHSRTNELPSIEQGFIFFKSVKKATYEISSLSNHTVLPVEDAAGYHYVRITFDRPIDKGITTETKYQVAVQDPDNEVVPVYGYTNSTITKIVKLKVVIPPELNPKKIRLAIYATNVDRSPIRTKDLIYSQEKHCISCVIPFPVWKRRYAIEWEW